MKDEAESQTNAAEKLRGAASSLYNDQLDSRSSSWARVPKKGRRQKASPC